MIHLVGHALFKSVLFMALGILLHMVGQQDSRSIPSVASNGMILSVLINALLHSTG